MGCPFHLQKRLKSGPYATHGDTSKLKLSTTGDNRYVLPAELWALVTKELDGDSGALKACSLTCRAWTPHAHRHLLSTLFIRIENAGERYAFRKRLITLPRVAPYAKAVWIKYIHEEWQEQEVHSDIEWFAHLLGSRRVTELTLEGNDFPESTMMPITAYFPTVTTLRLKDVFFVSLQQACAYRSQCTQLERLLAPESGHYDVIDMYGPPPPDPRQARLKLTKEGRIALDYSVTTPIAHSLDQLNVQELDTGGLTFELLQLLKNTPCSWSVRRLRVGVYGQATIDALETFVCLHHSGILSLTLDFDFDPEDPEGSVQERCTAPTLSSKTIRTLSVHSTMRGDSRLINDLLSNLTMKSLENVHLIFNNLSAPRLWRPCPILQGRRMDTNRYQLPVPALRSVDVVFEACPEWLSENDAREWTEVDTLSLVRFARQHCSLSYTCKKASSG